MCLILSVITALSISTTAYATTNHEKTEQSIFTVYSPEFPDAYIIVDNTIGTSNNLESGLKNGLETENSLGTVTATAFVEETYQLIDGNVVTTNSRLLSKSEVDAIGIANFQSLTTQIPTVSTFSTMATNAAVSSRGKLTITFSGTYNQSGNSVTCNLTGNAQWSGFNFLYSAKNNPAVGEDFFGLAWAGGFQVNSSSISASLNTGGTQTVYLSEAAPNSGRVWEFYELVNLEMEIIYVNNVNLSATLYKANKEGGGNTAEAVLKYIHTYQSTTGNIDISASESGVGAGFSLSNTNKQWNISCVVNGIPY